MHQINTKLVLIIHSLVLTKRKTDWLSLLSLPSMSFSNNPARKSLSSLFQQRCFVCSSPQWILLFHHRSYPFSHRWRRTHSRALCGSKGYVCGEEEEEIIVASIRFPLVHTHTSHTYIHPTANNCQTNISPPGHNLHTYGAFKKKEREENISYTERV